MAMSIFIFIKIVVLGICMTMISIICMQMCSRARVYTPLYSHTAVAQHGFFSLHMHYNRSCTVYVCIRMHTPLPE